MALAGSRGDGIPWSLAATRRRARRIESTLLPGIVSVSVCSVYSVVKNSSNSVVKNSSGFARTAIRGYTRENDGTTRACRGAGVRQERSRPRRRRWRWRAAKRVTPVEKANLSYVTDLDQDLEQLIRRRLGERFPDDQLTGEEYAAEGGSGPRRWSIDPIDGTGNLVHGLPLWAISIGLIDRRRAGAGRHRHPAARMSSTGP